MTGTIQISDNSTKHPSVDAERGLLLVVLLRLIFWEKTTYFCKSLEGQ